MFYSLKELIFGLDPKIADPKMGLAIVRVSDIRKENHRLYMYVERHTKNNSSLFKKTPGIKRNRNVLYFFSLNYSPTKADLDREYSIRNLKPANPNLLLKHFLDYKESFKKYSPAMTFFKSKKSINYSTLLIYHHNIDIRIYSKRLDSKNCFDKSFYFCGVKKRDLIGAISNFLSFLANF